MMGFFPSINTFPSLVAQAAILSCYKKRMPYAQNVFCQVTCEKKQIVSRSSVFLGHWE